MKKTRILIMSLLIVLGGYCFAFAGGDVFSAGDALVTDTKMFILKISTAMAVIGIGFGAFILKFSAGNVQKIELGKKAIAASIIGWTLVNGSPLIFSTIQKYF